MVRNILRTALIGACAMTAMPQPSQAAAFCLIICFDLGGGDSGGTGDTGGTSGGGTTGGTTGGTGGGGSVNLSQLRTPLGGTYQILEETVPYTGRTHVVMLTGKGVFPARTYAQNGDRMLIVNLDNDRIELEAANREWRTGDLREDDGYLLLVQPGLQNAFGKRYSSTIKGDFRINQLPPQVDYWEDTRSSTAILQLVGVPTALASQVLDQVAGLQQQLGLSSTVRDVEGGQPGN